MVKNTNTLVRFDSTTICHIRPKYRYLSRPRGKYQPPIGRDIRPQIVGQILGLSRIAKQGPIICRSLNFINEIDKIRGHQRLFGKKYPPPPLKKSLETTDSPSPIFSIAYCIMLTGVYPQDFFCRKQFYAINAMITGDGEHIIRNIVAKWSGKQNYCFCCYFK